jgi:hypothetical protein
MNSIDSEHVDINNTETNTDTNVDFTIKTTIKTYTHNDKKQLVKRLGDIKNKKCYIKIFRVIHGNNYKYTQNDNGIFFNLTNLPDNVLCSIENIINYYENKKNNNEIQLIKNIAINNISNSTNSNNNNLYI